jgi:hypothetical protein
VFARCHCVDKRIWDCAWDRIFVLFFFSIGTWMTKSGFGSPSGGLAGSAGGVFLVYAACMQRTCLRVGAMLYFMMCSSCAMCFVCVCGMQQDMAPDSCDLVWFTITSRKRGNNQRTDFADSPINLNEPNSKQALIFSRFWQSGVKQCLSREIV